MKHELHYEVHVEPQVPQSGRGPLPDGSPLPATIEPDERKVVGVLVGARQ